MNESFSFSKSIRKMPSHSKFQINKIVPKSKLFKIAICYACEIQENPCGKKKCKQFTISCTVCTHISKFQNHFWTHISDKHKFIKCPYCDMYGVENLIKEHEVNCKKSSQKSLVKCDNCDKLFARNSTLKEHQKSCTFGALLMCPKCKTTFKQNGAFASHIQKCNKGHKYQHREKKIPCDICSKLFVTTKSMQLHKEKTHKVFDSNVPCMFCEKQFNNFQNMRRHVTMVHKTSNAETERKMCLKDKWGKIENEETKDELSCEYCLESFPTVLGMQKHYQRVHGEMYFKNYCLRCGQERMFNLDCHECYEVFQCGPCAILFYKVKDFFVHALKNHPDNLTFYGINGSQQDELELPSYMSEGSIIIIYDPTAIDLQFQIALVRNKTLFQLSIVDKAEICDYTMLATCSPTVPLVEHLRVWKKGTDCELCEENRNKNEIVVKNLKEIMTKVKDLSSSEHTMFVLEKKEVIAIPLNDEELFSSGDEENDEASESKGANSTDNKDSDEQADDNVNKYPNVIYPEDLTYQNDA